MLVILQITENIPEFAFWFDSDWNQQEYKHFSKLEMANPCLKSITSKWKSAYLFTSFRENKTFATSSCYSEAKKSPPSWFSLSAYWGKGPIDFGGWLVSK